MNQKILGFAPGMIKIPGSSSAGFHRSSLHCYCPVEVLFDWYDVKKIQAPYGQSLVHLEDENRYTIMG